MRLAIGLGSFLATLGCATEAVERPPPAGDRCGGQVCSMAGISGGIAAKSSQPSSDAASPTTGAADAATGGRLAGEVVIIKSPDLVAAQPLNDTRVRLVAGTFGNMEVSTESDGSGEFALELPRLPTWVRVEPTDAGAPSELLTTIQGVAEPASGAQLMILERAVISEVSEGLALNPVALDPDRGHAIIHFTDAQGEALSQVVVDAPGIVAYDIGATYSDAMEATSDRGAAALFNVPAAEIPGADVQLLVTHEELTSTLEMPLAKDAITLAFFELGS